MAAEETLRSIDAKLGALLAIAIDQYLRDTGVARPRPRSVDRLLSDVGLSAKEIASVLGKTERAVHLVLAAARAGKGGKRSARGAAEGIAQGPAGPTGQTGA